MSDFYPLTIASKQYSMITHYIAGTNSSKTNGFTLARTSLSFTPIYGDIS